MSASPTSRPGPKLDLVELVMLGLALCAVALVLYGYQASKSRAAEQLAADGLSDLKDLERAYGPGHDSRFAEEWIVRDFFHDRRDGVFVDVGANDYRVDNNTYFLETQLGWRGIAIDAQREFAVGYQQHRPNSQFFALFVSDVTNAAAKLYIPTDRRLNASSNREAIDLGGPIETREVPTITLNDLLDRVGLGHVDYVSMDIELAEPKALAGFDIDRFRPSLVCIEADRSVRQLILDYFQKHQYVVVARYFRADTVNLYFTPVGQR